MSDSTAEYNESETFRSEHVHVQADELAERLNLQPIARHAMGRWERLIIPALLKLLDRIDGLEDDLEEVRPDEDDHR
jgi:hypothetical protein